MTGIAPGWYKDPADPATQRYWDGEGWIGQALPADAPAPPGPPPDENGPAPAEAGVPQGAPSLPGAGAVAPGAIPPSWTAGPQPAPDAASPNGDAAPAPDVQASTGVATPAPGTEGAAPDPAGPGQVPPVGWQGPPPPAGLPPYGQAPPPAGAPPYGQVPPQAGVPPYGQVPPAAGVPGGPGVPPGWAPYPPHRYLTRMPPPRPHGLPLATPGARLVARIIDIVVVSLLNVVVNGWFIWQYAVEISPTVDAWERYFRGQSDELPQSTNRSGSLSIVIILIAAALWLAYEVPAIADNGQTFGKRVLGIKVVRVEEPGPVGFLRSLRRWNTLGLPTLLWVCCGIGFVLQLVDVAYLLVDRPLQQALHDKSARTVVVSVAPAAIAGRSGRSGRSGGSRSSGPDGHAGNGGPEQRSGNGGPAAGNGGAAGTGRDGDERNNTPGGTA